MRFKISLLGLFFSLAITTSVLAGPQITLPNTEELNLGLLEEGRLYNFNFVITNTGDAPLEVRLMRVGCGCTTILYPKQRVEVAAGSSLEAKFSFNTEGMDGSETKYIYVESNDPERPTVKLTLIANVKRIPQVTLKRFLSFGVFTVVSAGLIDGVNPCAFTVLVFFISFLNFVGYRKRELVMLGSVFIFSVFLTYLLIGLGLFRFIQLLEGFSFISKLIYFLTALLAIILGFYSIYDWYIYKKTGNPDEVKLKLPLCIKQRIQKIVQNASRNRNRAFIDLAIAVFLSGTIVSLLESVCTGQTYLPTITYVLKNSSLRVQAWVYLILYNLMFIIPLIVILIAAVKGVTSEAFSRIARRHLGWIKLATAGLFFFLGVLLFLIKGGV